MKLQLITAAALSCALGLAACGQKTEEPTAAEAATGSAADTSAMSGGMTTTDPQSAAPTDPATGSMMGSETPPADTTGSTGSMTPPASGANTGAAGATPPT